MTFAFSLKMNALHNGIQKRGTELARRHSEEGNRRGEQFPAMVPLHPLALASPLNGGGLAYVWGRTARLHEGCSEKMAN